MNRSFVLTVSPALCSPPLFAATGPADSRLKIRRRETLSVDGNVARVQTLTHTLPASSVTLRGHGHETAIGLARDRHVAPSFLSEPGALMHQLVLGLLLAAGCAQAAPRFSLPGQRLLDQSGDGHCRATLSSTETSAAPPALIARLAALPELLGEDARRAPTMAPLRAGSVALEREGKLMTLPGFDYLQRARLSRDGSVLALGAGRGGTLDAWRITRNGERERLLPQADAAYSGVIDISDDGRTIVGWRLKAATDTVPEGFLWRRGHPWQPLPAPLWLPFALSGDGSRVLASTQPPTAEALARRTLSHALKGPAAGSESQTLAVSPDRSVAVGYFFVDGSPEGHFRGWLWRQEQGYSAHARAIHLPEEKGQNAMRFAAFRDELLALAGLEPAAATTVKTGVALWRLDTSPRELAIDARPVALARSSGVFAWETWQNERWQLRLAQGAEIIDADTLAGSAFGVVFAARVSNDGRSTQLLGDNGKVLLRRADKAYRLPAAAHHVGVFSNGGHYFWPEFNLERGYLASEQEIAWLDMADGTRGQLAPCTLALNRPSQLRLWASDDASWLAVADEAGYCVYQTGLQEQDTMMKERTP